MKKIAWIYAIIVLAFLVLPIPLPGKNGAYNAFSNLYWCSDEYSCLHEKAHQMDRNQNWISHSDAWINELHLYVLVQSRIDKTNPYVIEILSSFLDYHYKFYYIFNDPNAELYANIYVMSDGTKEKMPDSLEPFYLWNSAND